MKRLLILITTMLITATSGRAVPAKPGANTVRQPDGSMLSVELHGDEYRHYTTTTDGYTVVRNAQGYWVYAALQQRQLVPTAHVAHSADRRSDTEQRYLSTIARHQAPPISEVQRQRLRMERQLEADTRARRAANDYDYTKMRGLIILVEFNDQQFSRPDYKDVINDMVNTEDFTGYTDTDGKFINYIGSVSDYYRDNSEGRFHPAFDIVGPVTINRSKYYASGHVSQIIRDAIDAADGQVNFSLYDGDDNKEVDMIYFIFAGCGSHISGNNPGLLWPHASYVMGSYGTYVRKDNVFMGRYACSTELGGAESEPPFLDGIGTICHEFTHVLGLPDFYDVDYEGTGGESDHPGDFDIMASGSYLNNGRTPCGYTLFERYVMGFAQPQLISDEGSFELQSLQSSNAGYRLNSPITREYFLMENRQREKWDAYVPGHGLAVYRVDSTNTTVWMNNSVNNNPNHLYFQLLRSGGYVYATTFPGTTNKTELTRLTSPAALKTWAGLELDLGLVNIRETAGVISFDVINTRVLKELSIPATLEVGRGLQRQLVATLSPSYADYELTWSTADETVATVDQQGRVEGLGLGTTTVAVRSDNGLLAECEVTVVDMDVAATVADFRQLAVDELSVLRLADAQVLHVYNNDIYVRDASGAILLRNTGLKPAAGNLLNGIVYGRRSDELGMPLLSFTTGKTTTSDVAVSEGSAPEPRVVRLEQLTEADYCDMVLIRATQWVQDGGIYAVSGDRRIRLYNPFQIKTIAVPTDFAGKYYDVTGIFGTNTVKNVGTVEELKLLTSPVEVDGSQGIIGISADADVHSPAYNLSGQRVAPGYRGIVVSQGRKTIVK